MNIEKKCNGENFIGKDFEECLTLIDEEDICEVYKDDYYILIGNYYGVSLTLNFTIDFICESYEWDNADEWD